MHAVPFTSERVRIKINYKERTEISAIRGVLNAVCNITPMGNSQKKLQDFFSYTTYTVRTYAISQ